MFGLSLYKTAVIDKCSFSDLTLEFCQGFLTFLTKDYVSRHDKHIMVITVNNILKYFCTVLHDAFYDGLIKETIGNKIELATSDVNPREFLSLEEVKMLASTPCEKPVLQRASFVLTSDRTSVE